MGTPKYQSLIRILVLLIQIGQNLASLKVGWKNGVIYGKTCTFNMECYPEVPLVCVKGTCQCPRPADMIYDPIVNRCFVLAGKNCRDPGHCFPNAFCNDQGVCACGPHHYENSLGMCLEYAGPSQPCNKTTKCDPGYFLSCSTNETCECDPVTSVQNGTTNCLGLVGKPCVFASGGSCVQHAECDWLTHLCACGKPYAPSKAAGEFCNAVGYNERCSDRSDGLRCEDSLTCKEDRCKCRYDNIHQFYDKELKICRSFVRGPCDLRGRNETQCVQNSICLENPRTKLPECKCIDPYVPNKKGLCEELGIGSVCSIGLLDSISCDKKAKLVCRDGRCNCDDDHRIYDEEERRCRKLVGAICDSDRSCVEFAVCRRPYKSVEDSGQCECVELEAQTVNRTCKMHDNARDLLRKNLLQLE